MRIETYRDMGTVEGRSRGASVMICFKDCQEPPEEIVDSVLIMIRDEFPECEIETHWCEGLEAF